MNRLLYDAQRQLLSEGKPLISTAFIDGERPSNSYWMTELGLTVEFAPKSKRKYDKNLDPVIAGLLRLADRIARISRGPYKSSSITSKDPAPSLDDLLRTVFEFPIMNETIGTDRHGFYA